MINNKAIKIAEKVMRERPKDYAISYIRGMAMVMPLSDTSQQLNEILHQLKRR